MMAVPKAKLLDLKHTDLSPIKRFSDKDNNRLPAHILLKRLNNEASRLLHARPSNTLGIYPLYRYFEIIYENKYGHMISREWNVMVHKAFEKLFEGVYLPELDIKVVAYIFRNLLGYDAYFNAPAIIIRDGNNVVVDIIKYRPTRQGYSDLPKYLQKKSIDKPKNRGDAFLYPFQIEMERIIQKYGYVFVGEGIKNALNALIRSVPYITIESTSNVNNQKLIAYINMLHQNGTDVFGAMDGDLAGEKALEVLNAKLEHPINNLIDFDSKMDFTDYLRKETL